MADTKKDKIFIVAEYFFKKANEEPEKGLDSKKLQKLLYYGQAWNLVVNDAKLFPNEIEAWIHGPAVYEVWDKYKTIDFNNPNLEISEEEFSVLSSNEKKVLDEIWNVYGKFDGEYLEALTHKELPWQEARKDLHETERSNNIITTESMKSYYGKRLAEANESTS